VIRMTVLPTTVVVLSTSAAGSLGRYSSNVTCAWHAVRPVRSVLWRLDHGRQLKLLIVGVVALVPGVPLSVAHNLLVELYHLLYGPSRAPLAVPRG
jgi:hypothetical protein